MASTENVPAQDSAEPREVLATTPAVTAPQSLDETPKETTNPVASPPNSESVDATKTEDNTVAQTAQTAAGDTAPNTTAAPPITTTQSSQSPETKLDEAPQPVAVTEGEASDQSQAVKEDDDEEEEEAGPELVITLLLTTGTRHPFKINGKYLRRRSVSVENDDPFNMSVYTLKELIWKEWRSEWESRPSSPSSIRLISFGKLLDDKSPLSESSLTHDAPNVIHMTVKPQEVVDEEDTKGGKSYSGRDRENTERSPGCRCIIL